MDAPLIDEQSANVHRGALLPPRWPHDLLIPHRIVRAAFRHAAYTLDV
jgi:hypothetical protein